MISDLDITQLTNEELIKFHQQIKDEMYKRLKKDSEKEYSVEYTWLLKEYSHNGDTKK